VRGGRRGFPPKSLILAFVVGIVILQLLTLIRARS
jgi:hypothetical protein